MDLSREWKGTRRNEDVSNCKLSHDIDSPSKTKDGVGTSGDMTRSKKYTKEMTFCLSKEATTRIQQLDDLRTAHRRL